MGILLNERIGHKDCSTTMNFFKSILSKKKLENKNNLKKSSKQNKNNNRK